MQTAHTSNTDCHSCLCFMSACATVFCAPRCFCAAWFCMSSKKSWHQSCNHGHLLYFFIAKVVPVSMTQANVCLQVLCLLIHNHSQVCFSSSSPNISSRNIFVQMLLRCFVLVWDCFYIYSSLVLGCSFEIASVMQALSSQLSIRRWISNKSELLNFDVLIGIRIDVTNIAA